MTIQYLSVKGCRDVPWNVSTRVFGSRICLTEQYCMTISISQPVYWDMSEKTDDFVELIDHQNGFKTTSILPKWLEEAIAAKSGRYFTRPRCC